MAPIESKITEALTRLPSSGVGLALAGIAALSLYVLRPSDLRIEIPKDTQEEIEFAITPITPVHDLFQEHDRLHALAKDCIGKKLPRAYKKDLLNKLNQITLKLEVDHEYHTRRR